MLEDKRVHERGSKVQGLPLEELASILHLENNLVLGNSLHLGYSMVDQEKDEVGYNGGDQECMRVCIWG